MSEVHVLLSIHWKKYVLSKFKENKLALNYLFGQKLY